MEMKTNLLLICIENVFLSPLHDALPRRRLSLPLQIIFVNTLVFHEGDGFVILVLFSYEEIWLRVSGRWSRLITMTLNNDDFWDWLYIAPHVP